MRRRKFPKFEQKKNFGELLKGLMFVTVSTGTVGCVVQSPDPTVQDLIQIAAPSFQGKTNAFFSSPNQEFIIEGECDPSARSHEFSFDQSTWTQMECVSGRFQIPVKIVSFVDVYTRSWGKFSVSETSRARARFALPPTSPVLVAGTSSKSAASDVYNAGTQNMIASSFGASAYVDATGAASIHRVQSLLPRMAYEK